MSLAVDATNVYFTTDTLQIPQSAVMKVPVNGGDAVQLATSDYATGLVVDATSVYWSAFGDVMKVGIDGGTPVNLAPPYQAATALAVDANSVYYVSRLDGMDDDAIRKVGLTGGTPVDLVTGTNISTVSIDVDANGIYWTGLSGIMKVGLDGSAAVALAVEGYPTEVRVRDGVVYWINMNGGTLSKVPAAGGAAVVLASGLDYPRALAIGAAAAYIATNTEIVTVGLDGGTPTTLVSADFVGGFVNDIEADAANIYWVSSGGTGSDEVRKLPLPTTGS